MDAQNVLSAKNRSEFRSWLAGNSQIASECWVTVKRGKPTDETEFWYIDAEEEALCFGWIDSNHKLINGVRMQRFTPRKKNSPWTELNKERVRRLEKLSLMTDAGRAVLPAMGVRSYKLDADVEAALKQARAYIPSSRHFQRCIKEHAAIMFLFIRSAPLKPTRKCLHG